METRAENDSQLAIGDGNGSSASYDAFLALWDRANELREVISKLPGGIVLKSGMSGQRNRIMNRWDDLETPGLDGVVPDGAEGGLRQWIHDAEVLVGFIVQIGRGVYSSPSDNDDIVEDGFEVIGDIKEAAGVSVYWHWPWKKDAEIQKKYKFDKGKLLKYGAIAGLGVMALMTYVREEE